mgnify:CR=1 FL=1|jgi:hypothetical protein
MPKRIEPEVRERALRLLQTHAGEYSSLTAAAEAIAKQLGVGKETGPALGGAGADRWRCTRPLDADRHGNLGHPSTMSVPR